MPPSAAKEGSQTDDAHGDDVWRLRIGAMQGLPIYRTRNTGVDREPTSSIVDIWQLRVA